MGKNNPKKCWVGLDWGDSEHSICILDCQNGETTRFEVKPSKSDKIDATAIAYVGPSPRPGTL